MKKILLTLLILVTYCGAWAQLDPTYKQYQFDQFMINPAYAGIYNRFSMSFISNLQWAGIDGAPATNTLLAHSSFKGGEMGIGALLINDRLGVNNNTEGQLALSYNLKLGDNKLGMGLQGGLINYSYDLSKLSLDHVDDQSLVVGLENALHPNFGLGLMYMNANYYVGFSIPRLLNIYSGDGVSSSTRYKRHYYLSGGYAFQTSLSTYLKFNGVVRIVEGTRPSYDLSISAFMDGAIWSGITIRDFRYFGLFLIFEVSEKLRLGYSFELPSNSLIQNSYGTHEISISIDGVLDRQQILRNKLF